MITPRSFRPDGMILEHTFEVMLKSHPDAFDCIIWPAKDSSHDEILAVNKPVATLLDRDERAQEYDAPVLARAMIEPDQNLDFGATDSGLYESFNSATESFNLLFSVPGLRLHSIIQWRERLDLHGEECVERTVYIASVKPMGKTLNAGNVYVCFPLPAISEKPDSVPEIDDKHQDNGDEPDICPEIASEVGIL